MTLIVRMGSNLADDDPVFLEDGEELEMPEKHDTPVIHSRPRKRASFIFHGRKTWQIPYSGILTGPFRHIKLEGIM